MNDETPDEIPLDSPDRPGSRMLFMGDDSLADGFRLIGFEVLPNPSAETVDQELRALRRNRAKALVIVDDSVMHCGAPELKRVRDEGGRILIIAVPPLSGPATLSSDVADRLSALFGHADTGVSKRV